MKYKITVQQVIPRPPDDISTYRGDNEYEIYKQIVEELDLVALVAVVNAIQGVKPS